MKKRKTLLFIDILLLVLTLAFIWLNSLESISESSEKSGRVLTVMAPILELFISPDRIDDHLIRKLAHFAEFALLGCEIMLIYVLRGRRMRLQHVINSLSASLAAAVIDESLQLLSDRGSQVSDVLLDFCGAASGILFVLLIYGFTRLRRRRR